MSVIGTFTKQDNGYRSQVATFTLNAKVTFTSIEKTGDKAPDFRVFSGKAEVGAAWKQTSQAQNEYLSVRLDDPSFPAPINCRLIETDKGHTLVWNR